MRYILLAITLAIVCFQAELVSGARIKKQIAFKKCYGNLCEKSGRKYPTKKIKNMLLKFEHSKLKINEPVIAPHNETNNDVLMRSAFDPKNQKNMCKTKVLTILPHFEKDSRYTIVNIKGVYEQKLSIELCTDESGPCKFGGTILDHKTSCKQMYIHLRLLSLNQKSEKLEYRTFKVPNGCVCHYKNITLKEN